MESVYSWQGAGKAEMEAVRRLVRWGGIRLGINMDKILKICINVFTGNDLQQVG